MKKKLCSILLALTMVLTLLPVSALASSETLQSQIDAIETTGTIILDKSYTEDISIPRGKAITLDLNGQTLTNSSGDTITVSLGAELTIKGDGTVDNVTHGKADIYNNGTVTLSGGRYTRSQEADNSIDSSGGNSYYNILNHGEMTINKGVSLISSGHFSSLIASGYYNYTAVEKGERTAYISATGNAEPKLTINGGTFSGGINTIKNDDNATLIINDGTFSNVTQDVIQNNNIATINGGTFNADGYNAFENRYYQGGYNAGQLTVTNGNFIGNLLSGNGATTSISGGTFSDLSALDYLAEGANVTVKLAADTTKDVTIPAGTTVTLDLNGQKIVNSATAQDEKVAEASRKHTITNNGTLTILDSVGGGVVDNVSHGRAALYNAGTIVEIKGGKFTRSVDNSTDATSAKGNSWYVVYNAENATISKISSGEFLAVGKFSSLFCNCGLIGEITGGTFTQNGFIAFKNEGTVNKISGGTFSSESESCIQNWGTIGEISDGTITAGRIGIWNFSSDTYKSAGTISRITGGNISGTTAAIRLNDYDTDYKDSDKNVTAPSTVNKANASISAGNFSGALEVNANTVLTITGGTYTSDPSAYVAPGYVASYNGSTYTVYYPVPVIPNNNNNSSSTTTKNPDGSTTTTTTDKATGAVTETTTTANGSVGTVKTDANGSTDISASISAADVKAAEQKNAPVIAPITVAPAASSAAAPVIKLSVPASAGEVAVAIPVVNAKQGTVAVKVNPDGTEEIIKTAVVTENGLVLGVKGSMQIKVINNDKNFVDTVGHWAASDVDFVSARELFNGTAPALFSPEASMTRGMVVTVIARLAGENTDGGANWYDKGCAWAVANGVSDGTDPNGSITREQLAAMLYRYCGSPAASGGLSTYADAASVSAFASDAMQWCVNNGIINGMDGLLNPQGQATRAQVSAMFARYIRMAAAK